MSQRSEAGVRRDRSVPQPSRTRPRSSASSDGRQRRGAGLESPGAAVTRTPQTAAGGGSGRMSNAADLAAAIREAAASVVLAVELAAVRLGTSAAGRAEDVEGSLRPRDGDHQEGDPEAATQRQEKGGVHETHAGNRKAQLPAVGMPTSPGARTTGHGSPHRTVSRRRAAVRRPSRCAAGQRRPGRRADRRAGRRLHRQVRHQVRRGLRPRRPTANRPRTGRRRRQRTRHPAVADLLGPRRAGRLRRHPQVAAHARLPRALRHQEPPLLDHPRRHPRRAPRLPPPAGRRARPPARARPGRRGGHARRGSLGVHRPRLPHQRRRRTCPVRGGTRP